MRRLWRRYKFEGDEAAREELVLANLPLVRHILGRLPVSLPPGLGEDDLASVGVVALMRCVDGFDPQRGTEFATYAVPRIRGAMFDELRAHDIVPRSVRQRANAIDRACVTLEQRGRPTPSSEEIAREAGLSPDDVERTMDAVALRSLLSLEGFARSSPDGREQRILEGAADPTTSTPLAAVMAEERKAILADAIAALPERDRRVITLYYQGDLMLKEIAQVLSVTKSRVSQIHSRALFRLRTHIASALRGRRQPPGKGVS
jgi:RNA polymerase sigma factor for flagellar operon FliA